MGEMHKIDTNNPFEHPKTNNPFLNNRSIKKEEGSNKIPV